MAKRKYYVYLLCVILVWGTLPNVVSFFYGYMSAAVYSALSGGITAVSFLVLGFRKRHLLHHKSIKIAFVTGLFYSAAILMQTIGLQYTTPSMFAFLENTSCIAVPVLLFLLRRKKPHPLVASACVLCLAGCFVLSGASFAEPVGMGVVLCGLAGVFYGVNIVGTGEYAKEIPATLYLMIQKIVFAFTSIAIMLALHFIAPKGSSLEPMKFHWVPGLGLLLVITSLISGTFCWILRTEVTQNMDVTLVSVVMPMSCVITMVISVLLGTDTMTLHLALGAGMILLATVMSALGSLSEEKKKQCKS